MIQKKVCMIGTSAVGKTSLVSKFVHSIFSDKYLTTVGVKIDKRTLSVDHTDLSLVLWDLAGDDDFQRLQTSYLRGSSGFLLVADGTRAVTLDQVLEIHGRARAAAATDPAVVPCVLALNKADLQAQWELDGARLANLAAAGWDIVQTSAKTGTGVEEAFARLGRRMLTPIAP